MLVLCSGMAARESNFKKTKSTAMWLREFTNIDPLSIDQVMMTEKCPAEEDPYFKIRKVNSPVVFKKGEEIYVRREVHPENPLQKVAAFDIQVFHPRSVIKYGRPQWIWDNNDLIPYFFNPDKHGMDSPCLVLAYLAEEDINFAVPADVIEIQNAGDQTALALKPGKYSFVLRDKNKQKKLDIDVK